MTMRDHNELHHASKAARYERLCKCHEVLCGNETTRKLVDLMLKHDPECWHGAGLDALDAALQAVQQGHGDMMRASRWAAERSRDEMHVMGSARRAREHGLLLGDYERTYRDDYGSTARITYTLAFRDAQRLNVSRGDREVLRRALDAGLVGEPTRCQHAHDCCGHWYQNTAQVRWVAPNLFIVWQDSYQNV
jgi:hypothetical protein